MDNSNGDEGGWLVSNDSVTQIVKYFQLAGKAWDQLGSKLIAMTGVGLYKQYGLTLSEL
jgi:hypothetical protein